MKTYLLMLMAWVMTLGFVSCNKFLDVKPEDRFLSDAVFENEASVNNALNGIYLNLAKPALYGGSMTMSTIDAMAQYYYYPVDSLKQITTYNYNDRGVQDKYNGIWRSSYVAILNTNSFLLQLNKSVGVVPEARKDILKGEAYAIRAFLHFDLLRLFGPVYATNPNTTAIPYLTVPTEKIQPLLSAKTVMDSLLADIGKAELLLKNDPVRTGGVVAVSGLDPSGDFYKLRNRRLNFYAVLGLKARILLHKGDKVGAFAAARQVINEAGKWFPWTDSGLTLPGIQNPDRSFSSEVLFGVQNYDLYNQQRGLFAATLSPNFIYAPLPERLDQVFESNLNDYRYRINWVSGASAGKAYKTFVKYQDVVDTKLVFRNLQPLLRMSEMYYIAAECAPDPGQAIEYINSVRRNRGLSDLLSTVNLNDEIRKEYRKEFWGEGQTFFYYKRNAIATIPGSANNVDVQMNALKYVVPLPLSETQNR